MTLKFSNLNLKHFFSFALIAICSILTMQAQVGGKSTYNFLTLQPSARISSLGGNLIAVKDNDVNLAAQNPSLLNQTMNNTLAMNFSSYLVGVKFGSLAYAHQLKKLGMMQAGVHYISYGDFKGTDATSTETGSFYAGEQALYVGLSKPIDSSFTIGANVKAIYSVLEHYKSYGVAADVGVTYYNAPKNFTAALVVKNFGRQLKSYTNVKEKLPLDIQAALSVRLKHVPLRISLAGEHLEKWNLRYVDSVAIKASQSNLLGTADASSTKNKSYFLDKIMLHTVIGAEFLITKNFNVRAGFNYRRRKELKEESRAGIAGFSFGAGIKIYKFQISYGVASYHLGALSNTFSISTRLSDFMTKSTP